MTRLLCIGLAVVFLLGWHWPWQPCGSCLKEVSAEDLEVLLCGAGAFWWQQDATYWLPTEEGLKCMLAYDKTDRRQRMAEIYDCDDYARSLMVHLNERFKTNAIGLAWTGGHAFNVAATFDNGRIKLWVINPETDTLWQWPHGFSLRYKQIVW